MVAGSRSSLRRPTLRGHNSPTSSSPLIENTPPLLPKSEHGTDATRSKRLRASTASGEHQILKRRRLSSNRTEIPELRIPLRSRGGLPKVKSPAPSAATSQNAAFPKLHANSPNIGKPLDSPSGKPQYDQIRIIEERAKASIRGGGGLSAPREERRKLRSEDGGSRAKTELAQYFPDFEDMLSLKPPDPGKPHGLRYSCIPPLTRNRGIDSTKQGRSSRRHPGIRAWKPSNRSLWRKQATTQYRSHPAQSEGRFNRCYCRGSLGRGGIPQDSWKS